MKTGNSTCNLQTVAVMQVREIYETAIEAEEPYGLPDQDCKKLCLRSVPAEVQCWHAHQGSGNLIAKHFLLYTWISSAALE